MTSPPSSLTLHQPQRPNIVLLLTPPPFAFVTVITEPPTPDNEWYAYCFHLDLKTNLVTVKVKLCMLWK